MDRWLWVTGWPGGRVDGWTGGQVRKAMIDDVRMVFGGRVVGKS